MSSFLTPETYNSAKTMENELSEREAEVLRLASEGHIDDSIAVKMGISVSTVRGYWLRIRSKLGAGSRSELVARYVREQSDKRHSAGTAADENALRAALNRAD